MCIERCCFDLTVVDASAIWVSLPKLPSFVRDDWVSSCIRCTRHFVAAPVVVQIGVPSEDFAMNRTIVAVGRLARFWRGLRLVHVLMQCVLLQQQGLQGKFSWALPRHLHCVFAAGSCLVQGLYHIDMCLAQQDAPAVLRPWSFGHTVELILLSKHSYIFQRRQLLAVFGCDI